MRIDRSIASFFFITFLFLLTVPLKSHAIGFQQCWDGRYYYTCPAQLARPVGGPNIQQTTSSTSVETDKATGNLYWGIKETTSTTNCPTAPEVPELISGNFAGKIASGVKAITSSGLNSVNVTGLTSATYYCSYFYHDDGRVDPANATKTTYIKISSPWRTLGSTTTDPGDGSRLLADSPWENFDNPWGGSGKPFELINTSTTSVQKNTDNICVGNSSLKIRSVYDASGSGEYLHLNLRDSTNTAIRTFEFGKEYWFGFAVFLPNNWNIDNTTTTAADGTTTTTIREDRLLEFKSTLDPEDAARLEPILNFGTRNGKWIARVKWSNQRVTRIPITGSDPNNPTGGDVNNTMGNYERNKWTKFVIRVKFAWDDTGVLEIWKDGVKVVTYNGPNAFNDAVGPYLRIGFRKPVWGPHEGGPMATAVSSREFFFDSLKIGDETVTKAEVEPCTTSGGGGTDPGTGTGGGGNNSYDSTTAIKWNPGHYAQIPRTSQYNKFTERKKIYDSIASNPNIVGVWVPYYWKWTDGGADASLEGDTQNSWTMNNLKRDLDYLQSIGKKMIFKMMDNKPRYPKYMTDNGWLYNAGWAGSANNVTGDPAGWCRWIPEAMDRYIALYKEIAKNFDSHPALEAVILYKETAPALPQDTTLRCGYTSEGYYTQTKRMIEQVSPEFKHTTVLLAFNSWPLGNERSIDILKVMKDNRVGMNSPDTIPLGVECTPASRRNAPPTGDSVYTGSLGGIDYRGTIPYFASVENTELGGDYGNCDVSTFQSHLDNYLKASNVGWDVSDRGTNNNKWDPDILNWVADSSNAMKNVSCPSVYGNNCFTGLDFNTGEGVSAGGGTGTGGGTDPGTGTGGGTDPGTGSGGGGVTAGTNLETLSKVRFIGTGGNNNNNGLTHATRWADTTKARSLPASTDVYILAGSDNGKRVWDINWSGTEADRVVIGCYYLDSANGNRATSCEQGSGANRQTKPTIRGTYESSCRPALSDFNGAVYTKASTCPFNATGAIPKSRFEGLISIKSQRFVTVQDLNVINSSGAGIAVDEGNTVASRNIIQRNNISQLISRGWALTNVAENSRMIVRNNVVTFSSLSYLDLRTPSWGACNAMESSLKNTRVLFEGNIVGNCGGEGINVLRSNYNIARRNIVYNARRTTMYIDNGSYNVYENNLLIGGGYLGRQFNWGGATINVGLEPYDNVGTVIKNTGDSKQNVLRNNIGVNRSNGFIFNLATDSSFNCTDCINPVEEGFKIGGYVYGNTLFTKDPVESRDDAYFGGSNLTNDSIDKIVFKNNIVVGTPACRMSNTAAASSNLVIANNLYQQTPNSNNCKGSGDEYNSVPFTINFQAENGTSFLTESLQPVPTKFSWMFFSGYNTTKSKPTDIPDLDASEYPQIADFQEGKCKIAASDWIKPLSFDYFCNPRRNPGRPGALESGSTQ